jgi:hypothetical protein
MDVKVVFAHEYASNSAMNTNRHMAMAMLNGFSTKVGVV